jgi:flagella basal body P-ring formation protein FlgA
MSAVRGNPVTDPAKAIGMQLRRQVAAGQSLATADLTRPAMVQRGAMVQMRLQSPGLSLSGQGVALDSGASGERIRVLNPTSRAVLEAEVIAPGQVRVSPGSGFVTAESDRSLVLPR